MILNKLVDARLKESAYVKQLLSELGADEIVRACKVCISAVKKGKGIYTFGNGGSAADAQHFQAELQGMFYQLKKSLPVIAFSTNSSLLTAIANDIGYKHTFERQVEAHVRRGDIVIAISTSGNSENVLVAAKKARKLGGVVIGMTGRTGGKLKKICDICLMAPSDNVARVQECHTTICHIICEAIKRSL